MMPSDRIRNTYRITGAVQGVGFRPMLFRLATKFGLVGWTQNTTYGVYVEVEGEASRINQFEAGIREDIPPHARIQQIEKQRCDLKFDKQFDIRSSNTTGNAISEILPDIATCPECLAEVSAPGNRRYRYPFTNCSYCGPRYSIIDQLPYDRISTSMKEFRMCARCEEEYNDPANRRFHAQPNACPDCGPRLSLWDSNGKTIAIGDDSFGAVSKALKNGMIVAVKGIGGFQLMVDASNSCAVKRLRQRKKRSEKPFAVMIPSISFGKHQAVINGLEEQLLISPASPIVLLKRHPLMTRTVIVEEVAPENPTLGLILPYTPLHHILIQTFGGAVVFTSGNIANQPICIDECEALNQLRHIADLYLIHDRPIRRPIDDSVVRVVANREMMIRRSRGYAPMPISTQDTRRVILSLGAYQKNTIALQIGDNAFISQHIGGLETVSGLENHNKTIRDLTGLYKTAPDLIVADLNPEWGIQTKSEYQSVKVEVQHHHAHILSCVAEHQIEGPVLGVAWDGTGFGPDETIWGGEFLLVEREMYSRFCHFKPFRLPGSEKAIKEPRRSALGVLWELEGEALLEREDLAKRLRFTRFEWQTLIKIISRQINSPLTSSAGRFFDAVAALIGVRLYSSYEGQAAIDLENISNGPISTDHYPFSISEYVDWTPIIPEIMADLERGDAIASIAGKFHQTLVEIIVEVAKTATGVHNIVLSGGCFQNKILTEIAVMRLANEGFTPFFHQWIPPNDGGISFGQAFFANRPAREK